MKVKVALVYGGYSKEKEISINSANCVVSTIDIDKFEIYRILITEEDWFFIDNEFRSPVNKNDFSFQTKFGIIKPDVAYIMIHGSPGENGLLQGYFEMLNIPFTTCNAFVSALTFNKTATKNYLKQHGILTAKSKLLRRSQSVEVAELVDVLGLPLFIKPNNGGSSFGISKVKSHQEILPAIEKAFAEDHEVIVEEFIKGTELTCGVLKSQSDTIVFPVPVAATTMFR